MQRPDTLAVLRASRDRVLRFAFLFPALLKIYGGVTFGVVARFGLIGAEIASAAAYFAEFGLVVFGFRRRHSISPARLFRFRIADLKSFMASAVVGLRRNRLITAN